MFVRRPGADRRRHSYRVARNRRASAQTSRSHPRPLSLPLPSRKSSDRRLTQKPGRSSRPPTPAAATVPAATVTPVPEPNLPGPNLPGPNLTTDLTLPPPPRTASRRPPHQDRDRGPGDGAGAGNRGWADAGDRAGAGDRGHAATRFRAARTPRAQSTRALTQKAFRPERRSLEAGHSFGRGLTPFKNNLTAASTRWSIREGSVSIPNMARRVWRPMTRLRKRSAATFVSSTSICPFFAN
jgi:hypothetical protein